MHVKVRMERRQRQRQFSPLVRESERRVRQETELTLTLTPRKDKNMSLLELLEVDPSRLPAKCARTVSYTERAWADQGKPKTPEALAGFLDKVLRFCPTVGFTYPKIFLKRLKQLQRGQWRPRAG